MKTPTPDSATILLVDDEDAVQKLLTYPLEHEGFRVLQARDGEEALRRFAAEQVDLVVLDLMLPKLDGLEVCRRLRAQSTVPIIMLTARDDELDKVVGLELGADDYITKPFSIREFRSRVRALLRRAALACATGGSRDVIAVDGLAIDLATADVEVDGRRVAAHVRRVRAAAHARRAAGPRLQRGRCCSRRSGATPPTASRGRSTSTSAICARSSRRPARARADPDRARRRLPLPRAA